MKYQILFSWKNKKNINLLSAEFAYSRLSVNAKKKKNNNKKKSIYFIFEQLVTPTHPKNQIQYWITVQAFLYLKKKKKKK